MKNPFSIYDFLGYLFPGLLMTSLCLYLYKDSQTLEGLLQMDFLKSIAEGKGFKFSLETSILYVIVSYVMGHVVSYLSSVFIENFTNKVYGYPSHYLLNGDNYKYKDLWIRYFGTSVSSSNKYMKIVKIVLKVLLKVIMVIVMLPVTLSVYTIGYLLDINHFITRSLEDDKLIKMIIDKYSALCDYLKIEKANDNADFHRLIMHYVYINVQNCQPKVGNYIALYGFLRCMSFLACLLFMSLLYKAILSISPSSEFDGEMILLMLTIYILAYILFLGFVKFYRRNTLEDFMTLVVDKNLLAKNVE